MSASAFSALPITVAIHGTLLLFNLIRATGTPVKNCNEINMTAALRSWTFVFSSGGCRGADMVNNYNLQEEVERCRHFKEGVSLVHERAGPRRVLFPSNAAGAPQAYQHGVLSILSILWVGRLPVPTPSFHYSRLRTCVCVCWGEGRVGRQGGEKKRGWVAARKDDHEQDVSQKVVSCQQRGNGINISNVHSSTFWGGGSGVGKRAKSEQSESSETICR